MSEKPPPRTARLRKRASEDRAAPPPADQRTVLKLVDALAEARQRTRPGPLPCRELIPGCEQARLRDQACS